MICLIILPFSCTPDKKPLFKAIAFFRAKDDQAHISFVHEANQWFSNIALKYNFIYDTTRDWNNLNPEYLSGYQVVIFLDSRPDSSEERETFREYMENSGAWMGFHFAAFSLTPSTFPQNWDWYHDQFLGCGEYNGNTWHPTSALLRVENHAHPSTGHLPETFMASPNEWYKWKNDLRANPDIKILLSIDSASFPLGTGPKQYEIWHDGYYPVVWTNINYKMIYINMGHNDIDYENKTNKELSFTFQNETQNKLILECLFWLAKKPSPVKIILDTDIAPDYDDVGALAMLHALTDKLINNTSIQNSPVKDAYQISIAYDGTKVGRYSWDQTAVLVAVRGIAPFFDSRKLNFTIKNDGSAQVRRIRIHYILIPYNPNSPLTKFLVGKTDHIF